jgi:hypothetical protein
MNKLKKLIPKDVFETLSMQSHASSKRTSEKNLPNDQSRKAISRQGSSSKRVNLFMNSNSSLTMWNNLPLNNETKLSKFWKPRHQMSGFHQFTGLNSNDILEVSTISNDERIEEKVPEKRISECKKAKFHICFMNKIKHTQKTRFSNRFTQQILDFRTKILSSRLQRRVRKKFNSTSIRPRKERAFSPLVGRIKIPRNRNSKKLAIISPPHQRAVFSEPRRLQSKQGQWRQVGQKARKFGHKLSPLSI